MRHLIAEQVLLQEGLSAAHIEIRDDGTIRRIRTIDAGDTHHQAAIVRAREVSAGSGIELLGSRQVLLPGAVDTSVRLSEPGRSRWEGFTTGTMAAALGGVTTLIDAPSGSLPPTTGVAALEAKRRAAAGKTYVDTGFFGGIVPGNTDELEPLWEAGALGFVAHLGGTGLPEFPRVSLIQLREAMQRVRRFGGLIAVHPEEEQSLSSAERGTRRGSRRIRSYSDWAAARPPAAELAGVHGIIDAVRETGCRTHVQEVTTVAAVEAIHGAQQEGLPLSAGTVAHYLCFAAEQIPDASAASFTAYPPIRSAAEREGLWDGLQEGILSVVASGHTPVTKDEKYRHRGDHLSGSRPGVSGLQVSFAAVASAAADRGIGLAEVSRWTATTPARLLGLPKGKITSGHRADFLIFDPEQTHVVSAGGLAHKNPITAYERYEIHGTVVGAVVGGTVLFNAQDATSALRSAGELIHNYGAPAQDSPKVHRRGHLRAVNAS